MRHFPDLHVREFDVFKALRSPRKVQDFLNTLPINFESRGDTCRSPLAVLRRGEAHCMEGALLAVAALWYHGRPPLLLDLKSAANDDDHVAALFKDGGRWGAVTKTNHAVLRYRDPVFRTVRELALSYFNEYFLDNGVKTMRSHSAPFSMLGWDDGWLTADFDLWDVMDALDGARHFPIAPPAAMRRLRAADVIEREAGRPTEWKERGRPRRRDRRAIL